MPERWGGRTDTGPHSVPVWEGPKSEGRKGKDWRDWARENGMRWDSWDALALKKLVRMEESGHVDDEGRPILEKVDLMEAFFAGVHRQI